MGTHWTEDQWTCFGSNEMKLGLLLDIDHLDVGQKKCRSMVVHLQKVRGLPLQNQEMRVQQLPLFVRIMVFNKNFPESEQSKERKRGKLSCLTS